VSSEYVLRANRLSSEASTSQREDGKFDITVVPWLVAGRVGHWTRRLSRVVGISPYDPITPKTRRLSGGACKACIVHRGHRSLELTLQLSYRGVFVCVSVDCFITQSVRLRVCWCQCFVQLWSCVFVFFYFCICVGDTLYHTDGGLAHEKAQPFIF